MFLSSQAGAGVNGSFLIDTHSVKMSETVVVCQIEKTLLESLKKFRFNKSKKSSAIIMKVEKEKRLIVEEDRIEDCSTESLMEELPTHQPRFVVRR